MGLDEMAEKIHAKLFGGNMKKACTDQIPKLPHVPIILSLLLLAGCGSMETISIWTPELENPASMSSKVGVNPYQKYQEVAKFSAMTFVREPGDSMLGGLIGVTNPH